MTEFTHHHKRELDEALLDADDRAFAATVVPAGITPDMAVFAADISSLPPQRIPRAGDGDAIYGWEADAVRARIARDGGDIRFGWRLREWPGVLLMAHFHAVWADPQGTLTDITPDIPAGDTSLFLPVETNPPSDAPAPPPRYRATHIRPDTSADTVARIAQMKPAQRAYEEKRAAKAGKALLEWLDDKHHPDPLPALIPRFIAACEAFDARLPALPELATAAIAEAAPKR